MSSSLLVFFTVIFLSSSFVVECNVPSSKTFKFTNEGNFGNYPVEYKAYYRALPLFTSPFQLCFYNTTPNAFTLALRMGLVQSDSVLRWVWDANRGNPVRENATLTFGTDGNLVLADANGRIAWQTGTANRSVVGLDLLSNGNIVLYNDRGRFIWQSFEHPSDTILVGQSLRSNGPNRIISRLSEVDGSEGPYSLVLYKDRLNLYLKTTNLKKPLLYYTSGWFGFFGNSQGPLTEVLFDSAPETEEADVYELTLSFFVSNSSSSTILSRAKYNSTSSLLRLGFDGSLKVYTYYDKIVYRAWEVTFSLFDVMIGIRGGSSQCKLPIRCGSFGVCEDEQCVACPTPKGLLGWTKNCAPPTPSKCDTGKDSKVNYFKVVGVEHFLNDYSKGEGFLKLDECRDRCSKDCECLGFFYKQESSECLLAPVLGTLNKVDAISHVAYIKM